MAEAHTAAHGRETVQVSRVPEDLQLAEQPDAASQSGATKDSTWMRRRVTFTRAWSQPGAACYCTLTRRTTGNPRGRKAHGNFPIITLFHSNCFVFNDYGLDASPLCQVFVDRCLSHGDYYHAIHSYHNTY